jgi:hypothetical protein
MNRSTNFGIGVLQLKFLWKFYFGSNRWNIGPADKSENQMQVSYKRLINTEIQMKVYRLLKAYCTKYIYMTYNVT